MIHHLRRTYTFGTLSREQLPPDPMTMFRQWFEQLQTLELPDWFEINAMTLSTTKPDGGVASRIVLLKAIQDHGFTFFTNYESDKGQQIAHDPRVSLAFYWPVLDRQVRIEGVATRTDDATSDQYFASRPRESQLGAHSSPQSRTVDSDSALLARYQAIETQFEGQNVPRPSYWGGFVVRPTAFEFWQGRPSRLHDRFRYVQIDDSKWTIERLAP